VAAANRTTSPVTKLAPTCRAVAARHIDLICEATSMSDDTALAEMPDRPDLASW
jgi:hypothetical protein